MQIGVIIGSLAALASTISFAPQAWKIIRTGKTADISIVMYAITVAAFALWLTYGILQEQWPLVASNGICLILSGFILGMTLVSGATRKKVARAAHKR